MPVLVNLKKIKFEQKGNVYVIRTTDKSGRKSEMYLINEPNQS